MLGVLAILTIGLPLLFLGIALLARLGWRRVPYVALWGTLAGAGVSLIGVGLLNLGYGTCADGNPNDTGEACNVFDPAVLLPAGAVAIAVAVIAYAAARRG